MWKQGPMPKDTWYWGGVVTKELAESNSQGFFLCGFNGDHAVLVHNNQAVPAEEIVFYNNSIELPPKVEFEIKIKE